MIKQIDREACRTIRDEVEGALADLGKKLGVAFTVGRATFTPSNVTFKLEAATLAPDGSVRSREAEDFKKLASSFGLQPTDFGRKFRVRGEIYEITGLSIKSWKMPILVKASTGKEYKMPAFTVIDALKNAPVFIGS